MSSRDTINFAMIGCGGIALQNHFPALALCPGAQLRAICDADPPTLARARAVTSAPVGSTHFDDILKRDDIHAVIIATPNNTHMSIALTAIERGKHVFCEKPLALNYTDAKAMADAARAAGVRHMTAFTYRFVPAMRYLAHLVHRGDLGEPYHFRSCRLQDWGTRNLGWRQVKQIAGSGELGDMLSHRIDFAHLLVGSITRLVANLKQWHPMRGGEPNDLDDWVALLTEFQCGATGVLESSKLASGRNESWRSLDYVEVNGSERSVVFNTAEWNKLQIGQAGGQGLESVVVPREFWKVPGSARDETQGNPLIAFRYDQISEFVDAIRNERDCAPNFYDGVRAQAVMDAALASAEMRQWVDVPGLEGGCSGKPEHSSPQLSP